MTIDDKASLVAKYIRDHIEKILGKNYNSDAKEHFGVVRITCRAKEQASLDKKPGDISTINKYESLFEASQQINDLVGVRIVVETQRHKLRIVRALNMLMNTSIKLEKGFSLSPMPSAQDKLWKFFNPPSASLYSAPQIIRDLEVSLADSVKQAYLEKNNPGSQSTVNTSLSEYIETLHHLQWNLEFSDEGYASIQRVLILDSSDDLYELIEDRSEVYFELQIRTGLEDIWSELNHSKAYKGHTTQKTHDLLRNLGSQLSIADDLIQLIYDAWQDESGSDYKIPFSPFLRDFHLGKSYINNFRTELPELKRNLEDITLHRRYGRAGLSQRTIAATEKALEKLKFDSDPDSEQHRVSTLDYLKLEAAATLLYYPDRPNYVSLAKIQYEQIYNKNSVDEKIKFWAAYRLSFVIARSNQQVAITQRSGGIPQQPPALGTYSDSLNWLNEADRILNGIGIESIQEDFDATELDVDRKLWKATLLRRVVTPEQPATIDYSISLLKDLRSDIFKDNLSQLGQRIANKVWYPSLQEMVRRRIASGRRVNNALMYMYILKYEGSDDVQFLNLALNEFKLWISFVDGLYPAASEKAIEWNRRRLGELTSLSPPKDMNEWDCFRLKRYDTILAFLNALHRARVSFSIDDECIIEREKLQSSSSNLEKHIRVRLRGLALRGDVMFENDLLTQYKIL